MPYVYRPVDTLYNKPWVDGGNCVAPKLNADAFVPRSMNVKAPAGWQASSSLAHLGSAGMIRGNPRQLGYLVPTTTKARKSGYGAATPAK